jgi:hypothetical protein
VPIFDSRERVDPSIGKHGEPGSRFLNRVSGTYWDEVRRLIESWFDRFCEDSKADLRSRLRSSDNRQFASAFFELYLHETLLRAGYDVTCHPEIPGTGRHPDFLAESAEGSFYLEARVVSAADQAVVSENRRNRIYDGINGIRSPNFFLWVGVDEEAPTDPRLGPLRAELEAWLETLDPDDINARMGTADVRELPTFLWERDGWRLTFGPIAKSAEARGDDTGLRPLGVYGPAHAYWVDDSTPLKAALSDKGKAYGTFDRPYVVALSTSSLSSDDFDVMNALYGTEQVQFGEGPSGEMLTRTIRAPDGYWFGGDRWLHGGVSGVLIVRSLGPTGIAGNVPNLWHHPEPDRPLSTSAPVWRQKAVGDAELVEIPPAQSPADFFELPDPWPPGKPFPDGAPGKPTT